MSVFDGFFIFFQEKEAFSVNIFNVISLFGGLAMFLYGMRLMGDALKEGASGTLKVAMEHVTNNIFKAFIVGLLMTALIQSSTATIVITSGLVGAGILSLHQALGIIVGANVGTTVTGQIIRLLDLDASGGVVWLRFFQPSTLAPIAMIVGILLIMGGRMKNSKTLGNIAVGFGILFYGLMNMTGAVDELASSGVVENLFRSLGNNPVVGYLTGAGIAFVLQSSSATIGILQAFSATGLLQFKGIYSVIVGVYLGDCVTTAIVCAIGAKADARRVGIVNIIFNFGKSVLVLAGVTLAHHMGLLDGLWERTANSGLIANTNTIFNLLSALALIPLMGVFEKWSRRIVRDAPAAEEKYKEKLEALNPVFFNTPALALRSCYDLLLTIFTSSRGNIEKALGLLDRYDETVYNDIMSEEEEIDKLTDRLSRYLVELLPHLQNKLHVSILDEYYKVSAEFERLGDHGVNIADIAVHLAENNTGFSDAAREEIQVLKEITDQMLDNAGQAFRKRDVEAAYRIEPLVEVAEEIVALMRSNHLHRMSSGLCNFYADAGFTNLLTNMLRIADICSNVGMATVVRVKPELADHEHYYTSYLRSGDDAEFNALYKSARERYFSRLKAEETVPNALAGEADDSYPEQD